MINDTFSDIAVTIRPRFLTKSAHSGERKPFTYVDLRRSLRNYRNPWGVKSTHIRFRPLIRNADIGAIDRKVEGIYKESNKKPGTKEICYKETCFTRCDIYSKKGHTFNSDILIYKHTTTKPHSFIIQES